MSFLIRLLAEIPNPADATSFYRAMGPLSALSKTMDLEIIQTDKYYWGTFRSVDIFFVQRPHLQTHVDLIKMAKRCGTPIWIDYDDDLLNIPLSNPNHYFFEDCKDNIKSCLGLANWVTVSTEELGYSLFDYTNWVSTVIPNALDLDLLKMPEKKERKRIVLWRGSRTHQKDIEYYLKEIVALIRENLDTQFWFLGDISWMWMIREKVGSNAYFLSNQDILSYHQTIVDLAPLVTIVPLENNRFNRAKSNINWIESTYAGALTVGPTMPEWDRPGIIRYVANESFYDKINGILKWDRDYTIDYEASRKYIAEHLLLSKVNKLREDLIRDMIK